jgi:hypothetical protein
MAEAFRARRMFFFAREEGTERPGCLGASLNARAARAMSPMGTSGCCAAAAATTLRIVR